MFKNVECHAIGNYYIAKGHVYFAYAPEGYPSPIKEDGLTNYIHDHTLVPCPVHGAEVIGPYTWKKTRTKEYNGYLVVSDSPVEHGLTIPANWKVERVIWDNWHYGSAESLYQPYMEEPEGEEVSPQHLHIFSGKFFMPKSLYPDIFEDIGRS